MGLIKDALIQISKAKQEALDAGVDKKVADAIILKAATWNIFQKQIGDDHLSEACKNNYKIQNIMLKSEPVDYNEEYKTIIVKIDKQSLLVAIKIGDTAEETKITSMLSKIQKRDTEKNCSYLLCIESESCNGFITIKLDDEFEYITCNEDASNISDDIWKPILDQYRRALTWIR